MRVEELFSLHLAGLDNDDNLPLDLIEGRDVRAEGHRICTCWVHEDVSLVEVAPELFKSIPILHKITGKRKLIN